MKKTNILYKIFYSTLPDLSFLNKSKRLTNAERALFVLPSILDEILVGLLLGDLCAQKISEKGNTNLHFVQGIVHKDYLYHLYGLFKEFCNLESKITNRLPDVRTNKIYNQIQFHTYSLPCFNKYHELFYSTGTKIIPSNISKLLTYQGLAYWAMDDGNKTGTGFRLNTQSFTKDENLFLVKILKDKFDLDWP